MVEENSSQLKFYALDTNVLIHDPFSLQNFDDNHIVIPMTVLEELDKLKVGNNDVAADCRTAIRLLDKLLGNAPPEAVEKGIPIKRAEKAEPRGFISIFNARQ